MENYVYVLERYEECNEEYFLGTFSTLEKAMAYAEKDISTIKIEYRIDEDWGGEGSGFYEKLLIIEEEPEYYGDDIRYVIHKHELDPEFKEED